MNRQRDQLDQEDEKKMEAHETGSVENDDEEGLEYLQPIHKTTASGSSVALNRLTRNEDDDDSRLFMSEPSLSEGEPSEGQRSDTMYGLSLLSRYGSDDDEDELDLLLNGEATAPSPPIFDSSPGTTSLSSWDSPHFHKKVHVQFPENRRARLRMETTSNGPVLLANRTLPTRKKAEASKLRESSNGSAKIPPTERPPEGATSRSGSSMSSEQPYVSDGVGVLKMKPIAKPDTERDSSVVDIVAATKRPTESDVTIRTDATPHDATSHPGEKDSSQSQLTERDANNQSFTLSQDDDELDETLVMTLSASEGEEETIANNSEEPLDWEQQNSADDEQTEGARPTRTKSRRQRQRRNRNGDSIAAKMLAGGGVWQGMQDDQLMLPKKIDDDDSQHSKGALPVKPSKSSGSATIKPYNGDLKLEISPKRLPDSAVSASSVDPNSPSRSLADDAGFSVGSGDPSPRQHRRTSSARQRRRPTQLDRHTFWNSSLPSIGDRSIFHEGIFAQATTPVSSNHIPTFVDPILSTGSMDGSLSTLDQCGPESPRRQRADTTGTADSFSRYSESPSQGGYRAQYSSPTRQRHARRLSDLTEDSRRYAYGSFTSTASNDRRRYSYDSQHSMPLSSPEPSPRTMYSGAAPRNQTSNDSVFSWLSASRRTTSGGEATHQHMHQAPVGAIPQAPPPPPPPPPPPGSSMHQSISSRHVHFSSVPELGSLDEVVSSCSVNEEALDDTDGPSVRENMLQMQNQLNDGLLISEDLFEDRSFRGTAQGVMRPHYSPFAHFDKKKPRNLPRMSEFKPVTNVVEMDDKGYSFFVCPRCGTKQREFFTVASAPSQFESPAGYLALYFALYVMASLYIFGLEEGWPALDCVYFAVITLTTAGLGDLVPTSDSAKIICSIFIYFGVACIGLLLGTYLAGMLDDKSLKEAQQNRVDNCVRCSQVKRVRRKVPPSTHSSMASSSFSLSVRETSHRRAKSEKYGAMFNSERPAMSSVHMTGTFGDQSSGSRSKRQKQEEHRPISNTSSSSGSRRGFFKHESPSTVSFSDAIAEEDEEDVESSPRQKENRRQAGPLSPSSVSRSGTQTSGEEPSRPSARPPSKSAGSASELGTIDSIGEMSPIEAFDAPSEDQSKSKNGNKDVIDSYSSSRVPPRPPSLGMPPPPPPSHPSTPPLTPKQSHQQTSGILGSPMTRNILGRQSHTRHASLAGTNGVFSQVGGSRPAPIRHRNFSEDVYNRTSSGTIDQRQGTPTHYAQQPYSGSETDDYGTDDDSSYATSSDDDIDDAWQPPSRIKTAKYIFLTLRQALMNSTMIIAIGGIGFCFIENMSVVDSFYFTTVLLTTVGYGDIYPVTWEGKLFATIYVLVAGTVLLHNMSMISMIPLELRKKRIEQAVLTQFGDQLDDAALRELATGPLVERMRLSHKRADGLEECTREMFALAMLVRLGKVKERDVKQTFAAFRRLDVDNDGVLNSKTIIAGMMSKKRRSGRVSAVGGAGVSSRASSTASDRHQYSPQMPSPFTPANPASGPPPQSWQQYWVTSQPPTPAPQTAGFGFPNGMFQTAVAPSPPDLGVESAPLLSGENRSYHPYTSGGSVGSHSSGGQHPLLRRDTSRPRVLSR